MRGKAGQQTILIIDHDARVNDAMQMLITDAGYNALAAHDLDAAVHLLSSLKVDLVITNYMEPAYKRGAHWPVLEMFQHLVNPGTPIIVLTTDKEGMEQNARQLGVADVIGKPFALEDLLQRITKAIESRSK
jgi:DNA-binding response OmpR family regulator